MAATAAAAAAGWLPAAAAAAAAAGADAWRATWGTGGGKADVCSNATYSLRLDDPSSYNFCSVPGGGADAFLFGALAVLAACCLHYTSLSAVFVLLAGALIEGGAIFPFNLGRLGNAFTLWLGIDPPHIFFYAFLPPLLLDSALSIDYFTFNKVMAQVMVFAFLVVLLSVLLTTPVLLYGLRLAAHGWRWQHGALFSAMLASTDALAITAVLRRAGGPEALVTLMEGESLLNDASGIVLFELFHRLAQQLPDPGGGGGGDEGHAASPLEVLPLLATEIAKLAAGGVAVGLAAGVGTRHLLRALRWHGASAAQLTSCIVAMGWLVFYVANAPLGVSGVIAIVVYGLYGNSTAHFELESSRHMRDSAAVRGCLSFALNGLVFFFAGASAVNFMIRAVESLGDYWRAFALFPPLYLALFAIRGVSILLFNPLFHLLGSGALPLRAVAFATWGGLRGAISLIMVQVVVTDDKHFVPRAPLVAAQIGLWCSLFVLATLLVNAPTVPAVLRATRLTEVPPVRRRIREKARRALLRYTAAAIQDLKEDGDEMLRGVNWAAVARYVNLADALPLAGPQGGANAGAGASASAGGAAPPPADGGRPPGGGSPGSESSLGQQEELFEAAGWAAPSPGRGGRSQRAQALADLGRVSTKSPLASSRRLLGASFTTLGDKWRPRAGALPATTSAEADEAEAAADLETPLLGSPTAAPPSPRPPRGRLGSAPHSPRSPGRASSIDRQLARYGSGTGEDPFPCESPFFPASRGSSSQGEGLSQLAARAKSVPALHTVVEVNPSEEASSSEDERWAPGAGTSARPARQSEEQPLLWPEDSALHALPAGPQPRGLPPRLPMQAMQPQPALEPAAQQQQQQQQRWAPQPLEFDTGLRAASDAAYLAPLDASPTPGSSFGTLSESASAGGLPSSAAAASAGSAGGVAGGGGVPAPSPAPVLPQLRLARVSAPVSSSAPASPRAGLRLSALALAPAIDPSAAGGAPMSPRIRDSLLPAAANRRAVAHAGELLGGDEDPLPASPSSASSSAAASPSAPAVLTGGQMAMQWHASGRGPSRLLRTSGGAGAGKGAFAGLASVLKPLSPGKLSPLASAANSPEPPDSPAWAAPAWAAPAASQQPAAVVEEEAEQPPLPLLDQPEAAAAAPTAAAVGDTVEPADEREAASEAGDLLSPLPAAAAAWGGPAPELGRSMSLGEPPAAALPVPPSPFEQQQPGPEGQLHRRLSAAPLPLGPSLEPPAAASPRLRPVKPWQVGALLLRRSMSAPLTGVAEQLQQQPAAAAAAAAAGAPHKTASETAGLAGAGSSGLDSAPSGGGGQWSEEVLAEARTRLVAGLKRYFHAKRGEGLLSAQGLRILDYSCDAAMDRAHAPLDIWSVAQREAVGKYVVRVLAWLFFKTKRLTGHLPRWLRWLLMPPLRWLSGLLGGMLSATMLVACEIAVECWMGLMWSPQAQWLRESDRAGQLQQEIGQETKRVCEFIIDREIEAPERFQAIQSYRAAMAILRQQSAFVDELHGSGIVDDAEQRAMQEPIDRRARQLEIQGPVWRAPSVREVLRGLPFLAHVPEPLFDALLERGQLLEFGRGDLIYQPPPLGGGGYGGVAARDLIVVIYGLVRHSFTDRSGTRREYFLGSGGVLGLMGSLTGTPMPGSGPAVAEANALHKGPVVFVISQSAVRRVRQRAAAGVCDFAQLELDLFRVAGLYVVERLKGEVLAGVAAEHQRLMAAKARRRAIAKAAAAGGGHPAAAAPSGGGGSSEGRPGRVRFDLPPEAAQPSSGGSGWSGAATRVPLTDAEALQQLDRHRLWHSSQAFARGVLSELRHQLRSAELLHLPPQHAWRQRSHALLMEGRLQRSGGRAPAATGQPAGAELRPPSILPWLAPARAQRGLAPAPPAGGAQAFTAGSSGALLLVCPEEPSEPPTPHSGSSAGSLTELGGSPFAAERPAAGAAEAVEGQRSVGASGPALQPDGQPLHRVRSRRLDAVPLGLRVP